MPPAFNLSQDQTLEFNHCYYFICLSFLRRRAQNYRLVIFRSSRFCIIPFVFSSTWFFMSWSSSKPDAHAYRFVIQFLKIVTASQRQDEYLTLSILKMQIFFHSIFQWISWKQLIKTIIFLLIFSVLWISDSFHTNRAENLPFLRPVWKAQNA